MIDTHCHLTYDGLYERVEEVLAAAHSAGVDRMVTVGTTPDDAQRAIALARRCSGVFATVGIHPHYAAKVGDIDQAVALSLQMAGDPRVLAVGEMGLDWHYPDPPRPLQQELFRRQLAAAAQLDKPIIIHNREATDDVLSILRESGLPGQRFVFHCFTGAASDLDAILDFGAFVGFTGVVTFKNSTDLAAASDRVPLERLLIETDSPYLTPEPHRKIRPNEPRYVADVARFLAARRGMTLEAFTAAVDSNAVRFFQIPV